MSFIIGRAVIRHFTTAERFKVKSVVIDPSLQFIHNRDLQSLIDKNIFKLDLSSIERQLGYKYPQASELKITRRFPNRIAIMAKKRSPFAQIGVNGKTVVLDDEGVVLTVADKSVEEIPAILGARSDRLRLVRGLPLKGDDVQFALKVIRLVGMNGSLSGYSIDEVNVENLSKVYCLLNNKVQVILDRSQLSHKIRVLGVVLSEGKLDLKEVRYIDLRFKEPIIGKK